MQFVIGTKLSKASMDLNKPDIVSVLRHLEARFVFCHFPVGGSL